MQKEGRIKIIAFVENDVIIVATNYPLKKERKR